MKGAADGPKGDRGSTHEARNNLNIFAQRAPDVTIYTTNVTGHTTPTKFQILPPNVMVPVSYTHLTLPTIYSV